MHANNVSSAFGEEIIPQLYKFSTIFNSIRIKAQKQIKSSIFNKLIN